MTSRNDPRLDDGAPPASNVKPLEVLPEGEESAPRGARVMGIVRWALVALMASAAAGTWLYTGGGVRGGGAHASARFHCPMHPTVLSETTGSCPVCGMDLVPVASANAPRPAGATYWCPMHPEVTSTDPEARCQKCGGMKLLLKDDGAARAAAAVPGVVPLEIPADRTRLVGMRTTKVTRAPLQRDLRTVGFVIPNERRLANVTARTSGWIQDLEAIRASPHVQKGEILGTLFNPELRQRQQGFISASRFGAGGSAPAGGPEGRTVLEEAREQLRLLGFSDVDLDKIAQTLQPLRAVPLRAPLSGHVVKATPVEGSYVESGTQLFQIADLSMVWVVADVYENDMAHVRVGQPVRVKVAAWPNEVFTGRVQYVYATVNPATRTLQVRAEVTNTGTKLRPGMQSDVFLEIASPPALVVPAEAVVDTGDVQYVILAHDGGRFEPRRVTLGARDDASVEIAAGVHEGDSVVSSANFLIDSESRVRAALEGLASEPEPAKAAQSAHP